MKILSLFDGISCARVALDRVGINVEEYYASEIDKYAIQISQKNYPDIIRLGSVLEVAKNPIGWNDFDLLIGGSPCQDLSIAGKRKGLSGERSGLFWEYVRILKEVRPKYFILENVASMSKEARDTIIKELFGIEPVMINASLVSAQNRKRLFWVGKYDSTSKKYLQVQILQPEDKNILLKDILEDTVSKEYLLEEKTELGYLCCGDFRYDEGFRWRKGNKCPTMSTKGGGSKSGSILITDGENIRRATPIECERLQGLQSIEKSSIISICKEYLKNSVNVEEQNLKLQNVVGSVEKDSSQESVLSAIQSSNINNQQINKPAQLNVLINCEENKIEIYNQNKLLLGVSSVEWKQKNPHLKLEDFVALCVGVNTIVEKIINGGKEELLWKNNLLVVRENGNNVVSMYGKEIMQLVRDVEINSITLNKLLKFITLNHFTQENKEQIIQTLFLFVVNVILGYIPKEIQNQNILTFQINTKVGYTYSISNTQRYKTLGNAFNVDVVAHILKHLSTTN